MYSKLLEQWKKTKTGNMYWNNAGVFARGSVEDFTEWLEKQAAQPSERTCPVCDGEKGATIGGVWHDCTNCNGTGISR